jgi:phage terminase large subunit
MFNTCTQLIKNLPLLQHDENNPEDAADKPHEVTHSPESIRYFVMSRPSAASLKTDTKRDMFLYRTESVENSLLGGEVTRSYIEY